MTVAAAMKYLRMLDQRKETALRKEQENCVFLEINGETQEGEAYSLTEAIMEVSTLDSSINKLGGHRGVFHTPLLYAVLALIMATADVPTWLIQSFLFGTISHLILDSMNPAGVPLFWPFSKKRFHFLNIKTDSFGEKLFLFTEQVSCCILLGYQMFFT